ncbi:MAG TPA: diaminopimelate decarboxylase [Sphingorhabdus lacus]|jgi:diaminopimelate decarboxylase|uniref:Diaminopimelate decarboxylase n=1 Tax=Sphingorhabdus lacus TaxID=392610 RepID=A0A6I6L4I2_9SPHN|nr:diaminopimelate decarboxylase [Sphingorhabdus lacus]QGY81060.1 diaminopimelate decarboxylase [Sphingorhabdus lacus]HNW17510.1 diaminopimelate decarboxylase [Sphingorhabdus lacus]HPV68474.1 diaminopimelate decarboxylase [Sphingorhabdus lacus]
MNHFDLVNGVLHAEDVPLPTIADSVGTPVYVYSRATLERHAQVFRDALSGLDNPHLAFAVKANPNLAVLKVLARQGYGADVVSGGEMDRALAAGMAADDIVFSGVGKTAEEIVRALKAGIGQFNIESEEEGRELATLANTLNLPANAVLRINPDVDAGTHGKISTGKADNKFGVGIHRAPEIYGRLDALPSLNMRGVALHIGSQLTSLEPLETAFGKIGTLVQDLRANGHRITHVDLGGGLGVRYKDGDNPPEPADYGAMVARVTRGWDVRLMFEPGRVIAGNAGILLTRVIRVKPGAGNLPFAIVDAAMNDLARPALYDAWHDFEAVEPNGQKMTANIVGPVCETGDTFAMARDIDVVAANDLAIFRTAGAYGATMASTYNSRGLVPEVLVDGGKFAIVAERIAPETILAAEHVPDWLK